MDVEREAREQIVPTDEECDKLNKWLDAQDDPFQILAHMRKVGNVPQLLWMFAKDHDRRVRAQALRDAADLWQFSVWIGGSNLQNVLRRRADEIEAEK